MNCRAVNERKMDIHGVISIKVKIYGTKHNEIITDIDKEHIQLKRGTLPATNPLGFSEKIVVIEEELELNNGNDCIKGVLRSDARAIIDECKIVTNKALIKGDIIVNALYCTEENTIEKYENRIPFNQILDINIEGIDCRCDGKVEIMSCLLKPRTNLSGQAKSFVFECKMSITATASCDNDIPIVFDAFSTIYETDLEMNMIEFKKLDSVLNERYMCKKTLEFNSDAFGSVIDMWCESKVSNARIINKNMTIVGTALICLLTYDKEGKPQYYERGVDFEYAHNIETTAENLTCQARLETVSSAYTILDSDKLEARIELSINADIFAVISKNVITGIGVNKENQKAKKKCPLTVYYADSGEDLWDIAKHYNSNCKNIKDINNLTDDILENATMLLIP